MALLRDVIKEHGTMGAAQVLEVNYKTLVRTLVSRRLTGRMSDALERMLLSGGGSVAVRQRSASRPWSGRWERFNGSLGRCRKEFVAAWPRRCAWLWRLPRLHCGRSSAGRWRSCPGRLPVFQRHHRLGPASWDGRSQESGAEAGPVPLAEPWGGDQGAPSGRGGLLRCGHAPGDRVAGFEPAAWGRHQAGAGEGQAADHGAGDRNHRRAQADPASQHGAVA